MSRDSLMHNRAEAALTGLALGDALGMPSQTLTRDEILTRYGPIKGFVAPYADHPVSHGLRAGQVTDDTEQALILARRLIAGDGRVDAAGFAQDLLAWEVDVRARGLRDLLGPSTKAALDALLAGAAPEDTGRTGTTNGAAMRITPVGIAARLDDRPAFVRQIAAACQMTHNTGEAIAGAAAVAAVVSSGVAGVGFDASLDLALNAAEDGQRQGFAAGARDMPYRIRAALTLAGTNPSIETFAAATGTSVASHESVPAAFGVVRLAGGDPWRAALIAANIGDDTDTIGAIAGAMAGACAGLEAFPDAALQTLRAANDLALGPVADQLLQLRTAHGASAPARQGIC